MRIDVTQPKQVAPGMQVADTTIMERNLRVLQQRDDVETITTSRDIVRPGVYLVDSTVGDVIVRMPPAAGFQGKVTVKRVDASSNSATIEPTGGALVDGASSYSVTPRYVAVQLISDGANWWII